MCHGAGPEGGVGDPGHSYQAGALYATGGGTPHISFARKYYRATILRLPPSAAPKNPSSIKDPKLPNNAGK